MDPQLSRGPSRGSPRRGGRTSGSCLRHAEDGGGAGSRYGEDSLNPKLHLATPGCECRAETFRVVRPPLDGISIAGGDRHPPIVVHRCYAVCDDRRLSRESELHHVRFMSEGFSSALVGQRCCSIGGHSRLLVPTGQPICDASTRPLVGCPRQAGYARSALGHSRGSSPLSAAKAARSEEHTSELQSLMRNSYAVFCCKKKKQTQKQ